MEGKTKINWSRPVRTKNGRYGIVLPPCDLTPRRNRVAVPNKTERISDINKDSITVYRYDDYGSTNVYGQPSEFDVENYDD